MALCYNISYGIAAAFIFYCVVKLFKREIRGTHPILWVATVLFILNFALQAIVTKGGA
jgi:AGZA family xanthine/uracil permease-like MFS transporter